MGKRPYRKKLRPGHLERGMIKHREIPEKDAYAPKIGHDYVN